MDLYVDLEGNLDRDLEKILAQLNTVAEENIIQVRVNVTAKAHSAFPEVFVQEAQLRQTIQSRLLDSGATWIMGAESTNGHYNVRVTREGPSSKVLKAEYSGVYPFNRVGIAELADLHTDRERGI